MLKIGKNEVRISMVIKLAGAFCAFLIGAGFATGQEVMQYFTNYGIAKAVGVLVINGILGAWTSAAVMNLGNESRDVPVSYTHLDVYKRQGRDITVRQEER